MNPSRIEQAIDEIYNYVEECKPSKLYPSKVVVDREQLYDLLDELRLCAPEEIKRYQKIITNREGILNEAQQRAEDMLSQAQQQTAQILDQNEIAVIKKDSVKIYDVHGNEIHKELNTADWDVDAAEKGGYAHFMLKEIHEQPDSVKRTIMPRITDDMPDFSAEGFNPDKLKSYKNIYIVACGTAMHAGMVGKYIIEKIARVSVTVDIASEFRYRDPLINEGDLMIVISQSGETADTKAALELAKQAGADTMAIVNVKGSSIAREADMVVYTHAGPEISVASTKAYMVQVSIMYLIAFELAYANGKMDEAECSRSTKMMKKYLRLLKKPLHLRVSVSLQLLSLLMQTVFFI